MVNKKLLNNVLRSLTAGKEEHVIPPAEQQQNVAKPVQRWRYYFYEAPAESSIKFSQLNTILQKDTPDRTALVNKLQGGNTGKYFADYFRWKKVIVATSQYSQDGNSLVVYEASLNPMGTKVAGSEQIYPKDSSVTAETIEADLILFADKRGNSGVINVETSGESLFSDQDPPGNIVNVLLNRARPTGKFVNFNEFSKIFDEYRIWATNLNQLLLPNFDIPNHDDVPGGHYVGGQAAFNKVVGPVLQDMQQKQQQQPAEPSLKDKEQVAPGQDKGVFEPVDQQSKEPVKGDVMDNLSGIKKFSGQDYKIRRMARNVIAEYMEEDSIDKEAISTGTTVKGIGGTPETDEAEFKALATQSRTKAKKYDEMAQAMKQFKQLGTP